MARVVAPGTLSNLGPGFDVLGLALAEPVDAVTVEIGGAGLEVRCTGTHGDRVPADPGQNLAAFAADRVRGALRRTEPLRVTVEKVIPPGSGLGSSAASAVAGAVAAMKALGGSLPTEQLLAIGRDAEALAAGSAHLDNVAPALLGGFVAVLGTDPPRALPLPLPPWWFAVILPHHPVETSDARAVLPERVPMADAIENVRSITELLDACRREDLAAFARSLEDRLAAPYRASLWPFLEPARRAALATGAPALSISGSGPTVFAPCATEELARRVAEAVSAGLREAGFESTRWVTRASARGALG